MTTPRYSPTSLSSSQRVLTLIDRVHTYHCTFCSHLILASTHVFSSLPTRHAPGLDNATIVPLPKPTSEATDDDEEDSSSEPEDVDGDSSMMPPPPRRKQHRKKQEDLAGYTLLLTLQRDRAPKVIARADGFEKRVLWRCGRCRLIVAYQLDECHYSAPATEKGKAKADTGERYLYILPGAVTESSKLGKEDSVVELA